MQNVLNHLNVSPEKPSQDLLDRLVKAWSERIPWESASRIARHRDSGTPADYAWLPETFFDNAVNCGTGGTCFESNLAFRSLLEYLGFTVTLHFCDMEDEIDDPHCTAVVHLDGEKYLADVGLPVPAALHLSPTETTSAQTAVYKFTAMPIADNRWEVKRRSGDYEAVAFWLKGEAIDQDKFYKRLLQDHEPDGLFLREVIIQKIIDGEMIRYSDGKGLIQRNVGVEKEFELSAAQKNSLEATLSSIFGMDQHIIRRALHKE
ncbi:MAG: arylamine N-acetyltransferase [Chloroflexi bacterium]|nr:arylamine N-acetyltransferase [Chloroflexota bacterium]